MIEVILKFKIELIIGIFLLVMAIMDLKHKKVLSIIPTTAILFLVILRAEYLQYGIVALVFGVLLYEFGFFEGIADIKAMVMLGMTVITFRQVALLMVLIVVGGLCYELGLSMILKLKKGTKIPFLPLFFIVYVALMLAIHVIT